ncbi:N-acetyltransferase [Streptomyces sp. H51]|uniref:N-acetyltransferase n=1 Tax=Streptomyces sp. H51 TaxID=3111770 RepID=UPI002D786934|nr:N-acetyltransferase [Streptomyces sp. H51]
MLRDRCGAELGRLRFRACGACRAGRILDVRVVDDRRREGLGRELLLALLKRCPDHRWTTTLQTGAGRRFFTAMTEETSVPFPRGGPLCEHLTGRLTGRLTRAWRRATAIGAG